MRYSSKTILRFSFAVLPVLMAGCGGSPLGGLPLPDVAGETESVRLESGSSIPTDDCMLLGEPSTPTHEALFAALNDFRAQNGLAPLIYSERLEAAANAHARDLYERKFFAHVNPDGENPGKRAIRLGFCHEYVGENIAAGQKTVQAAQIAWENSVSHRDNMLIPAYKYVGVGVYQDPTGRMYWAQEMAYHVP